MVHDNERIAWLAAVKPGDPVAIVHRFTFNEATVDTAVVTRTSDVSVWAARTHGADVAKVDVRFNRDTGRVYGAGWTSEFIVPRDCDEVRAIADKAAARAFRTAITDRMANADAATLARVLAAFDEPAAVPAPAPAAIGGAS